MHQYTTYMYVPNACTCVLVYYIYVHVPNAFVQSVLVLVCLILYNVCVAQFMR